MERPTFIFAGGGTGGHLYPGLAVAEALADARCDARVVFACSNRPIDARVLGPLDHPFVPQPVRPIRSNPFGWPGFWLAWRESVALARTLLADLQPAAVLGLGGFAAGPVVRAAARAGLPTALLNPDAVPGKANRYLARQVGTIFTQFESTAEHFGGASAWVRCTGCPIRPGLLRADRDEAIRSLGLAPDRRTLLVFGGSLLARSLTEAVTALAEDFDELTDTWQLLVIAGPDLHKPTAQAFNARPIHAVVLEYCRRMDHAWAAADLALCRGGAGTVAELIATRTPAVILPYPHHADRQQYLNAAALADSGAALVLDDHCDTWTNAEGLRNTLLHAMRDESALRALRQAVADLARPDAASAVADWLRRMAKGEGRRSK